MEFLEIPLFDDDIYKLLVRLVIDLVFLTIMVTFAIYPSRCGREFAFTAVMMNVMVFFICFTLKKLELELGMALGLFAIFGVLRYRADAIRTKEMTYLFIVIGIAVINALSNKQTSYAELGIVNLLIFAAAILKEWMVGRVDEAPAKKKTKGKRSKTRGQITEEVRFSIDYDRIDLLGTDRRSELLADLRTRTGLKVLRAEVRTINLPGSIATLNVWCGVETHGHASSEGSPSPGGS
ncbi:MAG: DUF4956 domain-containing protein [Planctomycetaceae bacterium]|nr:DUF4956 domain-containing protein [Planctomycetaceae bacterium]